jgi:hypothetical protein
MSVRRTETRPRKQRGLKTRVADAAQIRHVDPPQAAPQRRRGPRVPDPIVAVDSAFSAHTPVTAAEVDAIIRLLGDDLDLILGGDTSS